MSAERDQRDGDGPDRRPRPARQDRPGGASGGSRDRQSGARWSSRGSANRAGGRPRRDDSTEGSGGERSGSAGGRSSAGRPGRFQKPGNPQRSGSGQRYGSSRDDQGAAGRPQARRPKPVRDSDTEGTSGWSRSPRRDDTRGRGAPGGGGRPTGGGKWRNERGGPRPGGRPADRGEQAGGSPRRPSDRSSRYDDERTERRDDRGYRARDNNGPRGARNFSGRRDDGRSAGRGGFTRDDSGRPRTGAAGSSRRDDRPGGGRGGFRAAEKGEEGNRSRQGGREGSRPPQERTGGSGRQDGGRRDFRGGQRGPRDGAEGQRGDRRWRDDAKGARRPAERGTRRPSGRDGRPSDAPRPRRDPGPPVPEDVTGTELDATARAELKTLPKDLATEVARHLVMAGRLIDDDPELAYQHALAARGRAARVGIVREACGIAAYHAGLWSVALSELRAARRLTGQEAYLAIMADAERGLGRPERALDLAKSDEARRLPQAEAIEMRIVESGVRRDLGQPGAAVLALQVPELKDERWRPWSTRLFYAYADALIDAGREEEASDWFARAAAADRDGETDAAERYAELEGLEIIDTEFADVEPGSGIVTEAETQTGAGSAPHTDAQAEADVDAESEADVDAERSGDLTAEPSEGVATGPSAGTVAGAETHADAGSEMDADDATGDVRRADAEEE